MTIEPEALLAEFDDLRDRIRVILARARVSCGTTDLRYATDRIGILAPGKFVPPDDPRRGRMIYDVALFDPNDRGIRPFDRFLSGPARTLPETEQDLARRMGQAFFSLFRFIEKHETGGYWLEDILANNRRLWVMTPPSEDEGPPPPILAMRIFDSGPYFVSLSVAVSASDRIAEICAAAGQAAGRLPFTRSLAATIYGLSVMDRRPTHPSGVKFARELAAVLKAIAPPSPPEQAE